MPFLWIVATLLTISNSFISLPFPSAGFCQTEVVTECNRKICRYYGPIIRLIGFTRLIGSPTGWNATRCLHQLVSRHNELVLPYYCTSSRQSSDIAELVWISAGLLSLHLLLQNAMGQRCIKLISAEKE